MQYFLHDRVDEALSKVDAFVRLLSYLQDVGTPEARAANRDAEGYLLEVVMSELHEARVRTMWTRIRPANDFGPPEPPRRTG